MSETISNCLTRLSTSSYISNDERAFIITVRRPHRPDPTRGLLTDCYPVEALPQSTLDCFGELGSSLTVELMWGGTTLDNQMTSHFATNSTGGDMVQKLMVEDWKWERAYGGMSIHGEDTNRFDQYCDDGDWVGRWPDDSIAKHYTSSSSECC